ncbi:MAG: hypothetical protein ISS63_09905 [Desulfobacteraceae bacterium]|nr:hypothetical protein [Desulfobacteraceae bacterium]
MKIKIWSVLFLLILFTACAPTKKIKNWVSNPSVQKGGNRSFEARFEPLKGDKKFFVSFRLSVMNKTDKSLKVDWNKTRYIYKGRPYGGFVFYGIDPATIKDSIPPDLIAPGKLFSKEIFPTNLVAFTPIREEVLNKKGRGIYPGPIPAGENGISLVILQGEQEIVEKIVLNIRAVAK